MSDWVNFIGLFSIYLNTNSHLSWAACRCTSFFEPWTNLGVSVSCFGGLIRRSELCRRLLLSHRYLAMTCGSSCQLFRSSYLVQCWLKAQYLWQNTTEMLRTQIHISHPFLHECVLCKRYYLGTSVAYLKIINSFLQFIAYFIKQ